MKRTGLLVLLTLLVIAIVGGGIARLLWLGTQLNADGPLALAAATDGGFFLSTDAGIMRFDAGGTLVDSRRGSTIGIGEPGAMQQTADGILWVFDKASRRLMQCTASWRCNAVTSPEMGLDSNAQFNVNVVRREIAVADNNRHRLLLLDMEGHLQLDSGDNPPLHYPNQVNLGDTSLLIADTDRRDILRVPVAASSGPALGAPSVALHTSVRPYRFFHDEGGWWVLEGGESLIDGNLAFYADDGTRKAVPTTAADPVDLLDGGDHLIVASRKDFRLLALDKRNGSERLLGGDRLNEEWQRQREQQQAWRAERTRIPLFMMLVLLPVLGGASILQKQTNSERALQPAKGDGLTSPSGGQVVMRPDAAALKTIREEFIVSVIGTLLSVAVILAICWLSAGTPPPAAWTRQELYPLLGVAGLSLLLLPAGVIYAVRQRRLRLGTELVFGMRELSLRRDGNPVAIATYAESTLDESTLTIGKQTVSLGIGQGLTRKPLWPYRDIKAILDSRRIPASSPPMTAAGVRLSIPVPTRSMLLQQRRALRIGVAAATTASTLMLLSSLGKDASMARVIYLGLMPLALLLLVGLLFLEMRTRMQLGRELLVSSRGVVLFSEGRAVLSATPDHLFLGGNTLVVGSRGIAFAMQRKMKRIELFPNDELRSLITKLIPADHVFATDNAMILALLKIRHPYAIKQTIRFLATMLMLAVVIWLRLHQQHIL